MIAQFWDEIMINLRYNDHQALLKLVKTSFMCSDYFIKVAILRCIRSRALCVWHSYCRELDVSSLSFLIALLLCIQQTNKTGANSAIFFFPWKSQNDRMKEKYESSKTEVLNRSERNKHNGDQRKRGRGTLTFPPARSKNEMSFFPPHKKGNESVSFFPWSTKGTRGTSSILSSLLLLLLLPLCFLPLFFLKDIRC